MTIEERMEEDEKTERLFLIQKEQRASIKEKLGQFDKIIKQFGH
jgi:hypothetical protein